MSNLTPGTPLRLSKEKLSTLSREIQNLITDLETQSAPLFEAMAIWQQNYEAIPKHSVKNFPFANASNVVIPLAKTMVDSHVAGEWNAVHGAGRNIWQPVTQNTTAEPFAKQAARFLNWQADGNDFDFGTASHDWLHERAVHGSSVLAGNWHNRQTHVYVKKNGKVTPVPITWARGPLIEHVNRYQILWDTSYSDISVAPAVCRQFVLTWAELSILASEGDGWLDGTVEEVRDQSGLDGPDKRVRDVENTLDHRGETPAAFRPHDIREVTVSWPHISAMDITSSDLALPGNKKVSTPMVDLVVTIHRKTGRILRLTSQPYFWSGKPFFNALFHKRTGRGHSTGMVKMLEQLQAGMTTIFNQGIDAQTRANSIFAKTNIRALLDKPIDMSTYVWDPSMKGVEPLNFPGSAFMNIQLLQTMQAQAERLSGQSDPALGRETRLGGHSAPATTTLALMERGNTLAAPDRGLLARTIGRVGQFILTLNQQFEDDSTGKIDQVLGREDGDLFREALSSGDPIAAALMFNIRGLSREDNPDSEMQKQGQIFAQTSNYWQAVLKIVEAFTQTLQVTPEPLRPINIEAYTQALKGLTRTQRRFLDAADIDDVENFILTVNDPDSHTGELLEAFAARAREGQGAMQPPNQPGMEQAGIPPGVDPSGIPGANGGGGPVQ